MQKIPKEELLKPEKKWTGWLLLCLFVSILGACVFTAGFFQDSASNPESDFSKRNFLFIFGGSWMLVWGVIFLLLFGVYYAAKKRRETLLLHGQYGSAVILKIDETGDSEGSPLPVKMKLEIYLEGFAPYQVEETMEVPILKISQPQVGSTVEVLAAPAVPGVRPGAVKLLYK
ncbi:MAG TPA: hypothetical protein VGB68_01460 [Pyrinomonadaceae bacterium]|jgi:hypothetical protein